LTLVYRWVARGDRRSGSWARRSRRRR